MPRLRRRRGHLQQQPHHVRVAVYRGKEERRVPGPVAARGAVGRHGRDLDAPLQQTPSVLQVAVESGVHERRAPVSVDDVHKGTLVKQAAQRLVVPVEGYVHEGGPPALVGGVDVRAAGQQVPHHLDVAVVGGGDERRPAILAGGLHRRPILHQAPHGLSVAVGGRVHQGRAPALVRGVHRRAQRYLLLQREHVTFASGVHERSPAGSIDCVDHGSGEHLLSVLLRCRRWRRRWLFREPGRLDTGAGATPCPRARHAATRRRPGPESHSRPSGALSGARTGQ
mmetsp:Transcript_21948/g.62300  ORF Transcript_21948/g.62300 Transcript_21948/m.62300 type:complete len:282 (-) Transcript_21948:130-975(-)